MDKKAIRSWMMYDWANSAFATTIMAAVLPVFYYDVAAKGVNQETASIYWGYSSSIAVFIVAILSPILGAIADYTSAKKKFLRFFVYLGIGASILLGLVGEGDLWLASILMILGTIGYAGGNVFYDAFLPEVAPESRIDQISARGYAYGYLGGGILLLINIMMIMKPQLFLIPDTITATQLAFVSVGVWWFLFSLPLFKNVHEQKKVVKYPSKNYAAIGFRRVLNTLKDIHKFKQLFLFLLAFWLFNDGISTIIKMATIYGKDIGIESNDLILALLITQFIGIPCAYFFGWFAGKVRPKPALIVALIVYTGIVLLGYFMTTSLHFYLLAATVGLVQGGAQALSRSIFGSMVPKNRHAEFYGFYGVSAKFSAIFGPFVFALVGHLTGSSRLGILSLLFFFVVGIGMLLFVDVEKGKEEARVASS